MGKKGLGLGKEEGLGWEARYIKQFPCDDLRILDQLWVQFSGGRFGFSVQRNIYVEVGGNLDERYDQKAFDKFSERVKWSEGGKGLGYNKLTFGLMGAQGHLPAFWLNWLWVFWSYDEVELMLSLAQRTANCNI